MKKLITIAIFFAFNISYGQSYKDCGTALALCGESPFYLELSEGIGEDDGLDGSCISMEFNSIWLKWTVIQGGLLTFELSPEEDSVDLDFVVYKFNTQDDCSDKEMIRCMASGENIGQAQSDWEICMGPTGLAEGNTDEVEYAGCSNGDNNFLAPILTSEGDQYVMLVNSINGAFSGFELSFGGTSILECISYPISEITTDEILDFRVYSAASNGEVNIQLLDERLLNSELSVYDINGRFIYNKRLEAIESDIDLSSLKSGVYIITVQKGNIYLSKKFVLSN